VVSRSRGAADAADPAAQPARSRLERLPGVVAISFVHAWLRLRSGSVFPPALLHATSNAFMGAFEALTKHSDVTSYFTYEYGLGFALVVPLLSLPFWKAGQRLSRAPFATAPASVSY
jgi:hypothetical protein